MTTCEICGSGNANRPRSMARSLNAFCQDRGKLGKDSRGDSKGGEVGERPAFNGTSGTASNNNQRGVALHGAL